MYSSWTLVIMMIWYGVDTLRPSSSNTRAAVAKGVVLLFLFWHMPYVYGMVVG